MPNFRYITSSIFTLVILAMSGCMVPTYNSNSHLADISSTEDARS